MEDRNRNYNPNATNSRPLDFRDPTYSWIIAAVLAVAVVVGILYFNHNSQIASQAVPPTAASSAQTTTPVQ